MKAWLKCCAYLAVALLLVYGLLLAALNAGLGRWLLETAANRMLFASAGAFRCRRVVVTPTLRIRLQGVSVQVPLNRQRVDASVARCESDRSLLVCWGTRRLMMQMSGGAIKGHNLAIDGIDVRFDGPLPGTATATRPVGYLRIHSLRAGHLTVNQLEGAVVQEGTRYVVHPLAMQALSGALRGTLTVELQPQPRVTLALQASQLALGDLAPFNAAMFQGARGTLHGTIQIATDAHGLASFEGAFVADLPGGTIGPSFLQMLLPYLPRTAERERLSQAIARGTLVPFESGSVTVAVVDPQHIKMVLNMAIPEYNLHVSNATLDIRLDSPALLTQCFEFLGTLQ